MSDVVEQRLIQARSEWTRLFASVTENTTRQTSQQSDNDIILSTENMRTNIHWGDEIKAEKRENTTRIYCQNVNGFKLDKEGGQYSSYCKIHQEINADVSCCQEINLDTTQHGVQRIMFTTTQRHWQRSRLTMSSTPIAFSGQYKPGGTLILSTGAITGRIQTAGTDKWGRWSYQSLLGHNGRSIIIISTYQPVSMSHSNRGTYTVSAQQRCLLLQENDPLDNPRRAFRRDLAQFLTAQLRSADADIILTGDFNERMGDDPNGISSISAQFQLVDILANRHPSLEPPATYARGRNRLDYALGTHRVAASIQECGYEQFNFRFHTDHRPFYMDFDTQKLFGSPTQQLCKLAERGLQSRNVTQITKYIAEKHRMLTEINAFNRAQRLDIPGDRHKFAEKLDKDVVHRSLAAEKRTSKYGEPMWSQKLIAARKKVSILSKLLSMHKTGIDTTAIVQHELSTLTSAFLLPTTLQECNIAIRKAKRDVSDIIAQSFEVRDNERAKQIEELESDHDPDNKRKAKILRNLKKAEEMKQLFQKLQVLRAVRKNSGITRIEVPTQPESDPKKCTDWQVIEVPTEILHHLQNRNRSHFGQAKDTPFTSEPLATELGFTSDTDTANAILDGNYNASSLTPAVQILIAHLKYCDNIKLHDSSPILGDDEYSEKLKSWRESTSTSPSGLHLGHYKALIVRHAYSELRSDEPARIKWDSMQLDLRTLHLSLTNYALQRGYSYSRWQQVSNAMLFKEENNIKIHRTRVIHLYEADYNLAMGVKWRAALYKAEDYHALNQGQYGSRPNRNAHDPIFIEEFQFEISRTTRKSLLQTNYDATSCYDRIVPNLAAIVSRKFGVPETVVLSNVVTLLNAKYRLKTELGTSTEFYQHSTEHPIYGTGQGSGNSPMIWCFLSSILFDCYEKQAHGAVYELPDRSGTTSVYMVGYVDDSNGQTNKFRDNVQPQDSEILQQATHDAQTWHDVLGASGGALELPKCSYQLLSWQFTKDGVPYLKMEVPIHPVTVSNTDGTDPQNIPAISAHTAHKTLGHYKDPAGNQSHQHRELIAKCNKAADFVATSPISRSEAWTYYFAIFLPSVGYPLASCHFSERKLEKVQRRAMSNIIAKCGYNRHTKREVIYGPAMYGGANFRTLYSIQSTGQVTAFLKYWRSPCQAGQLLRHATAWTQYALGTSVSFLTDVTTALPHMEAKWLASLRQYLATVSGRIELDHTYIPRLERINDRHIMDLVLQSHRFTPKEIRMINYCRLYLQAVTISDVTTATGRDLDLTMLQGMRSRLSSKTKWHHFNQSKPSTKAWKLWRRANGLWSRDNGTLTEPLREWLQQPSLHRRTWHAYQDSNELLYIQRNFQESPTYSIYFPLATKSQTHTYYSPFELDHTHTIPSDAAPVSAEDCNNGTWRICRNTAYGMVTHTIASSSNLDFMAYVGTLDPWELDLLHFVQLQSDIYTQLLINLSTVFPLQVMAPSSTKRTVRSDGYSAPMRANDWYKHMARSEDTNQHRTERRGMDYCQYYGSLSGYKTTVANPTYSGIGR